MSCWSTARRFSPQGSPRCLVRFLQTEQAHGQSFLQSPKAQQNSRQVFLAFCRPILFLVYCLLKAPIALPQALSPRRMVCTVRAWTRRTRTKYNVAQSLQPHPQSEVFQNVTIQEESEGSFKPFYFHSWKCLVSWFNFTPAVCQSPTFLSCEMGLIPPTLRGCWENRMQ